MSVKGSVPFTNPAGPRKRVVISNDLAGDPDGLLAMAHAVLCSSAQVTAIVATKRSYGGSLENSADLAKAKGEALLGAMGVAAVPVHAGSNDGLRSRSEPMDSPGARAIVAEANRMDTSLPLFVTCGAALTDVASALLLDPSIAERLTVVWIGGAAYPDGGTGEPNFSEDPIAAQVVFNDCDVPIWQIPSDVYSRAAVSNSEIQHCLIDCGAAGEFLWNELYARISDFSLGGFNLGETYSLGDSPLVAVTALTSAYEDAQGTGGQGSSEFTTMAAPCLEIDGHYTPNPSGRTIRVFTSIDTRLIAADFFAKMRLRYAPQ
jgi:inosine-uridine nucleoside N-ribohydrolase